MSLNHENTSGNIRIRTSPHMHECLSKQSKHDNISMNQLCISYLSKGLSESPLSLGKEKLNTLLEALGNKFLFEQEDAYIELETLYENVLSMRNQILYQIDQLFKTFEKESLPSKNELYDQITNKYSELSSFFPIYCGWYTQRDIVAILKIPHLNLLISPTNESATITLQKVENLLSAHNINTTVAHSISDIKNAAEVSPLVVHFHYSFSDLRSTISNAVQILKDESKATLTGLPSAPAGIIQA